MWKHGRMMLGRVLSSTVFVLVLLYANTTQAELHITNDRGGQIGEYMEYFARVSRSGETVKIDGDCLSACTLVLTFIPKNRVCVTEKARLGFHAAWRPNENGRPVISAFASAVLWGLYQTPIRKWITKNGGLTGKMIYLKGAELTRIAQRCPSAPQGTISAQASPPR